MENRENLTTNGAAGTKKKEYSSEIPLLCQS